MTYTTPFWNKSEAPTFYAIHDPAHQNKLVHNGKYLIHDFDYNVVVVHYLADLDVFRMIIENNDERKVYDWFMDEGEYIPEPVTRVYDEKGLLRQEPNLFHSKIDGFMPININLHSFKK